MRIRITEANRDRIDAALTFNGRYKIALGYHDIESAIKTAEAVLQLAYRLNELTGTTIELAPGRTPDVKAYKYSRAGVWATIERTTSGWSLIDAEHRYLERNRDSIVRLPDGDKRLRPWLAPSGGGSLGGAK